jgi:hypothetical protein
MNKGLRRPVAYKLIRFPLGHPVKITSQWKSRKAGERALPPHSLLRVSPCAAAELTIGGRSLLEGANL